ncbi:hypothetical protein D9M71_814240 [compost metagenome]
MDLLRGKFRGDRFQTSISLGGTNPQGQVFFTLTHPGHHALCALGGVDGGSDSHPRQIEQVLIAQHLQLYRQQVPHLVTQGQVRTVRRFLFRRYPDP